MSQHRETFTNRLAGTMILLVPCWYFLFHGCPAEHRPRRMHREPAAIRQPEKMITLRCPDCGNEGEVSASLAGKTVRCRECEALLSVPEIPKESEP